jgi:hypothetical protein
MSNTNEYRFPQPILLSDLQKHIDAAAIMLKTPVDLLEIVPDKSYLIIRIRTMTK